MADADRAQPESIERLAGPAWVRQADLVFTFMRSSGPGGQAVNKINTAAQLRVPLESIRELDEPSADRLRRLAGKRLTDSDELLIQSRTHRSQIANRRACLDRLRELVAEAIEPPRVRKKTRPGRAAVQRRLDEKQKQAERKTRRRGWEGERDG